MDTVRKETAGDRRRRAGLACRRLRGSAGQRKAGRRGRRPSPPHARLAGQVELQRNRRVCRATEVRRLTNTDSWPRVTCPHGVGLGRGHTIGMGMLDEAEATEGWGVKRGTCMLAAGARCSESGSIHPTTEALRWGDGTPVPAHACGLDIGPRPRATVVNGHRNSVTSGHRKSDTLRPAAHLAGCMDGCRTPSRTRRSSLANVWDALPVRSPSPLSTYQHLARSRQMSRLATGRDYGLPSNIKSATCSIPYPYSRSRDLASVRR